MNPEDFEDETTDFGFERVATQDKTRKVNAVFESVSPHYDFMNDLMSAGLHRLWKRFAVSLCGVLQDKKVLDLACGTGDLASLMAPRIGEHGLLVAADINDAMLRRGRSRLEDEGWIKPLRYARLNAEALPFESQSFDCITMAFGLRNVTSKETALAEMYRVLAPGGRIVVLEFSRLRLAWLEHAYDWYSFQVLPQLGKWVASDADSYRYLAESIRTHPDQDRLKNMMADAGFCDVEYFNLSAGVVAVHRGFRW